MRPIVTDVAWFVCACVCVCVCVLATTVSPKTDEPIEVLFGVSTRVGQRNRVLNGNPDPPEEGAICGTSAAGSIGMETYGVRLIFSTLFGRL